MAYKAVVSDYRLATRAGASVITSETVEMDEQQRCNRAVTLDAEARGVECRPLRSLGCVLRLPVATVASLATVRHTAT